MTDAEPTAQEAGVPWSLEVIVQLIRESSDPAMLAVVMMVASARLALVAPHTADRLCIGGEWYRVIDTLSPDNRRVAFNDWVRHGDDVTHAVIRKEKLK